MYMYIGIYAGMYVSLNGAFTYVCICVSMFIYIYIYIYIRVCVCVCVCVCVYSCVYELVHFVLSCFIFPLWQHHGSSRLHQRLRCWPRHAPACAADICHRGQSGTPLAHRTRRANARSITTPPVCGRHGSVWGLEPAAGVASVACGCGR